MSHLEMNILQSLTLGEQKSFPVSSLNHYLVLSCSTNSLFGISFQPGDNCSYHGSHLDKTDDYFSLMVAFTKSSSTIKPVHRIEASHSVPA